ncbi:MAG: patatin-like phospholipase family protein [Planctomycetes bacterium]|nr:patatin-like phospholipase family protein [Planctomycetota bacterium]
MSLLTADAERVVAWLKTVRFCDGLNSDQLAAVAGDIGIRPFVAGETLASAGDEVTEFWILVEGELDTFLTDPRGREKWLGTIRQGETVGEIVILENAPTRPLRFSARTHGTLLFAPAALLHEWVKNYPQMMQNLFLTLSERFRAVAGAASRNLPSPRVGIVAMSPRACVLAGRLAARLLAKGERLRAWASQPSGLTSTGSWPDALPIEKLAVGDAPHLQPPTPEVDRQMVVWSPGSDGRTDYRQLLGCDELLWLLEPRDVANLSQGIASLKSLSAELAEKVRIVWLLDADTPVAPLLSGWEFKKPDVKVAVDSTGDTLSRNERQGLDRLVRALRGISVGIALAGGGAKGMAHFGVLHALEEAGLSFDIMSGTSAGAMAGILYASGMSPQQAIQNFQNDLTPWRLIRYLPKWPNLYLVSQYRRRAWDAMLRKYLHDWKLEQLAIPFNAVTVDLVQVRTVVRRQGDAVHAILESINLPIVSRPILRDGMALVDGGVLNNLPADVLAESGADFVVGVDVSSRVRNEFAGNRPDMPTVNMKNAGALDTLFRIFESQAHNMGKMRNRAVDFWIKPDTSGFGLAEFHRTAEIAAAGEAAALDTIAELKQRLQELEKQLLKQPRSRV